MNLGSTWLFTCPFTDTILAWTHSLAAGLYHIGDKPFICERVPA